MFFFSGIVIGLAGSLHCLGMCGPIALLLPVSGKNKTTELLSLAMYNSGRIITYSLLGLLFGLLGTGFIIAGYQSMLSITMGILMLFSLLAPRLLYRFSPGMALSRWVGSVKRKLAQLLQQKNFSTLFLIGLLNGLLPCGLVYLALTVALASGSAFQGTIFMAGFGLGTVPAMMGIMFLKNRLQPLTLKKFRSVIPVMVAITGVLLILRGLNLGIPFISPEAESEIHFGFSPCCHKP